VNEGQFDTDEVSTPVERRPMIFFGEGRCESIATAMLEGGRKLRSANRCRMRFCNVARDWELWEWK